VNYDIKILITASFYFFVSLSRTVDTLLSALELLRSLAEGLISHSSHGRAGAATDKQPILSIISDKMKVVVIDLEFHSTVRELMHIAKFPVVFEKSSLYVDRARSRRSAIEH
jgi:hypothetical protein